MDELFESRIDLSQLKDAIERVEAEMAKVVVGQTKMIRLMLAALLSNGHVLIEGYPGIAKTLSAKLMAKTVQTNFTRIQFTPDLMPSDLLGTSIFNFKTSDFEFRQGPLFSNIVLIDEINRAPAKTQSALFEVMEERQITLEGKRYPMDFPFLILATQNPIDLEGTYRLPEAQMDRFIFKIGVDYPEKHEEIQILNNFHNRLHQDPVGSITPVLKPEELRSYQELVRKIHVEEHLMEYIAELIWRTRSHKDMIMGGSPRASLSVLSSSKAVAAMQGRDFVTPDDIHFVFNPVLRHRIMLTPEKEMEGADADAVLDELIKIVEVPR